MKVLHIETSTPLCSVAFAVDGRVVASRRSGAEGDHASRLPLFVDDLLREVRGQGMEPEAVAVSGGPGSYTGLRIGASMAKGLAYGMRIPLVAVPTLQVLAAGALLENAGLSGEWRVCPMMDARRMEVYTCLYDSRLRPLADPRAVVMDGQQAAEMAAEGPLLLCGDGAAKCLPLFGAEVRMVPPVWPEARFMAELAETLLAEGKSADVAYFEPFYLKEFAAAPSHVKGLQ